jgi:hypothetical protein
MAHHIGLSFLFSSLISGLSFSPKVDGRLACCGGEHDRAKTVVLLGPTKRRDKRRIRGTTRPTGQKQKKRSSAATLDDLSLAECPFPLLRENNRAYSTLPAEYDIPYHQIGSVSRLQQHDVRCPGWNTMVRAGMLGSAWAFLRVPMGRRVFPRAETRCNPSLHCLSLSV